jgi:hypothetical protein
MSPETVIWITAFCGVLAGYLLGFWHGWRQGKKWGEADGVRWARERLEDQNRLSAQRVKPIISEKHPI